MTTKAKTTPTTIRKSGRLGTGWGDNAQLDRMRIAGDSNATKAITVTKEDVTTFARYFTNMAVVACEGDREQALALIDELRAGVIADEVSRRRRR